MDIDAARAASGTGRSLRHRLTPYLLLAALHLLACGTQETSQWSLEPSSQAHFITTWTTQTPENPNERTLTLVAGEGDFSFDVDWEGDGRFDAFNLTRTTSHQYDAPGTYTIHVRGRFPHFLCGATTTACAKLLSVDQWGDMAWESFFRSFAHAQNVQIHATDAPDLRRVRTMSAAFAGALQMNQPIGDWDVGQVRDLSDMFRGAAAFTQSLEGWDTSQVVDMSGMFSGASSYDLPLGTWDVRRVKDAAHFLDDSGMTPQAYDATLRGWARQGGLRRGLQVGARGVSFCTSSTSRADLRARFGWSFLGDTRQCAP